MNKVVAIVPIRHNSQRVPGKNYRLLGNIPLYQYILNTLISSNVNNIIIDTDSPTIIDGLKSTYPSLIDSQKIIISKRPIDLCKPTVSMNDIIDSIFFRMPEILTLDTIVLQTHVTNPFLTINTINNAITMFVNSPDVSKSNSMVSVTKYQHRLWSSDGTPVNHNPKDLIQTQDLPKLYEENSNFYIFRVNSFYLNHNRLGTSVIFFELDFLEAWDIDTEQDFLFAQLILQQKKLINHDLLNKLQSHLHSEITTYRSLSFHSRPNTHSVMISAPYMIPDINTFKHFFNSLNIDVVIADVQERLSPEDLAKYNNLYHVALIGDDAFNSDVLAKSGVKALCKWGTGIDSISLDYCKAHNIDVFNTPDAFSVPVAQSIMAAIFGFLRNTFVSDSIMKKTDIWTKVQGKTLEESVIGIIGLGNIGSRLASYLIPFGPKILGYDIVSTIKLDGVENVSFNDILAQSDIVCLCTTLNSTSYHLINDQTIKLMKQNSFLINMARGPLIEQQCLIKAILNKQLAGAALDVFEHEPLHESSPFRQFPNVIISSHNTNSSPKYWEKVHINTIRNSLKALIKLAS